MKNTIPAHELTVSIDNQAEIHGVNIIVNDKQHKIFNVYIPPGSDLSLGHMQLQDSKYIILRDFTSHSEAWGYKEAE